jgi:carbonic anhydrase
MARDGREQSPIDIVPGLAKRARMVPLEFVYESTTIDVMNNGHTVEDDYHGGGTLNVDGHEYRLAQFHFHAPSEHTIDGDHFPMEMNLVHKDDQGALAVVAVMFEHGDPNPALAKLEEFFPTQPGRAERVDGMTVNASDLLPSSPAHYRYDGSLTTPPCTEGVKWFVMRQPVAVSEGQVQLFNAIIDDNNRPMQPLNGRVVIATR